MNIQAELISIGNELLSGRTLNTHGRDLGEALAAIGLQLSRDTTIPDDIPVIGSAVDEALARVDLVFASGGLGPTIDDITRDALAKLLNQKVVIDQPTVDYLKEWYEQRGRTITLASTRQAQVLESAVVLPNSVGAAPGQRIELPQKKILFVLPGPPNEFNAILSEEIIPWLKKRYADARPRLVRVVCTQGIGESDIVTILEATGYEPQGIDLGFYPGMGKVEIRLAAAPGHEARIEEAEQTLRELLAGHLELS
ncbi:competence/damage-inducible protein A [Pontiella sulfatireligans]|uniref:Competence-damage inducible protein n=1 Tax=Pontiella sulfatireligans TaxID=2750658 RepID=A0A6C2UU23_9BACT|nr:molybdopterin-binding protein [Pontiella sulfatireligans]VGO22734.1 Putative competence-damage inducible protein [Pontiella sulfatireligans]